METDSQPVLFGENYFPRLPLEVLRIVFDFLDSKSLAFICCLCRDFNHVAGSDYFWEKRFLAQAYRKEAYIKEMEERSPVSYKQIFLDRQKADWKNNPQYIAYETTFEGLKQIESFKVTSKYLFTAHQTGDVRIFTRQNPAASLLDTKFVLKHKFHNLHKLHSAVWWIEVKGNYAVTAGNDGYCKVIDVESCQILHSLKHDAEVWTADLNLDGKFIISAGAEGFVFIWSLETGKLITKFEVFCNIFDVAITAEGLIVVGNIDGNLQLWTKEGVCVQTLLGHAGMVSQFQNYPDENLLLSSGSDGKIVIVDVAAKHTIFRLDACGKPWATMLFEDKLIAGVDRRNNAPMVKIWKVKNPEGERRISERTIFEPLYEIPVTIRSGRRRITSFHADPTTIICCTLVLTALRFTSEALPINSNVFRLKGEAASEY